MEQAIGMMIEMVGLMGGAGLFLWAFAKALPEFQKHGLFRPRPPRPIRTWRIHTPFLDVRQVQEAPVSEVSPPAVLLQEMQALRRQMAEMQSTSHQFDLAFDAALSRLEERISRVESRSVSAPVYSPGESQRIKLS